MNYQESLDYIKSLVPTLERPSLTRIDKFFADNNSPQNKLRSFHVGGTNGKGSVSTLIASMVSELGYSCAKFTGPHLLSFNERFVVDSVAVDDSTFAQIATLARNQSAQFALGHPELGGLTWFEFLMAMAVEYYRSKEVDYSVFEVGMGGRFDATNVLSNVAATVITNVDLDHMQFLGDTREKIAFEKAGILKKGTPAVTTCDGAAQEVILERCRAVGAPLFVLKNVELASSNDGGRKFFQNFSVEYLTPELPAPDIGAFVTLLKKEFFCGEFVSGLNGAYQRINILTALIALAISGEFSEQLGLNGRTRKVGILKALKAGLLNARWPGRFEIIEEHKIIIDGAHNPHGAGALRASLLDKFGSRPFLFIVTCFENKDAEQLLASLLSADDTLITFAPASSSTDRSMHTAEKLSAIAQSLGARALIVENFEQALIEGHMITSADKKFAPYLIAAGSFATVREAIRLFQQAP